MRRYARLSRCLAVLVVGRVNDEHPFGRLYMRRLSPWVTWALARASWSPNAVTTAFVACGVAAGVVIAFGGLGTAVLAAVLVQLASLVRAETDGVVIARALQGLPATHSDEALVPRAAGLARLRRSAQMLQVHRIIQQIELSVLVLLAAIARVPPGRPGRRARRALARTAAACRPRPLIGCDHVCRRRLRRSAVGLASGWRPAGSVLLRARGDGPLYLVNWFTITMVRERRSAGALRAWLGGFAEGWRVDPGERRPLSPRPVWRMTSAGRPPVI